MFRRHRKKYVLFCMFILKLFCISDSITKSEDYKPDLIPRTGHEKKPIFLEFLRENNNFTSVIIPEEKINNDRVIYKFKRKLAASEEEISELNENVVVSQSSNNAPIKCSPKKSAALTTTTLMPRPLNISKHFCSFSRYQAQMILNKYINEHNDAYFSLKNIQQNMIESYVSREYDPLIEENLEYDDDEDYATQSESQTMDFLPAGCLFQDNDAQTKIVICTGRDMIAVPIFSLLRFADILIFNSTSIQVLDRDAIMGLPKVSDLVFTDGVLMRVAFGELFNYQPHLTNLTLVRNSIPSLSFSNFYNSAEKDILNVLDLRNNLITTLPEAPVRNETVLHKLEVLSLGGNPLGVIPGDFFYPLRESKVKTLYLRDSAILDYGTPSYGDETSPFAYLPHLEIVDLSHNPQLSTAKLELLFAPFENGSIREMTLNDNSYLQVPTDALEVLKHSLQFLSMIRSSFYCLDNISFPLMPALQILNLQYSRISQIKDGTFDSLVALQVLRLDGNILMTISPALSLPSLKVLTVNENPSEDLSHDPNFRIMESSLTNSPNLTLLSMAKDPLKKIYNYFFQGLKKLMKLTLTECSVSHIEDGSFADLTNLQMLHLGDNELRNISRNTFIGLSSLWYLDLSQNKLNFYLNLPIEDQNLELSLPPLLSTKLIHPRKLRHVNTYKQTKRQKVEETNLRSSHLPLNTFSDLSKLKILNLRDNNINFLSPNIFNNFAELRELDLTNNRIKRWDEPLFSNNPNLILLLLRNNELETITDAMIEDFKKPNLIVDLRENIFTCSCSLFAFNTELNNTRFVKKSSYLCFNSTDVISIDSYTNTTEQCEEPQDPQIVIGNTYERLKLYGVLAGLTVICLTIAVTTYRNRWYLKYLAYKLRVKVGYVNHATDSGDYEYDTFVCYAQSDRQWIFEKLIGKLESAGSGLRVCVHERDFLVGEEITHNIIRSVEVSRKVLVVISRAFVQSSWCMFELQMASNKILDERKNKLILLLLEPIPANEQPKELKLLLRSRTYVSWVPDIEGEKLFWIRLLRAISKPTLNEEHMTSESSDEPMKRSFGTSSTWSSLDERESSSDIDFGERFDTENNQNDQLEFVDNVPKLNSQLPFAECQTNIQKVDTVNEVYLNQCFEEETNFHDIESRNYFQNIYENSYTKVIHASNDSKV